MKRKYTIFFKDKTYTVEADNVSYVYETGMTLLFLDSITTAIVPNTALITILNDE